MEESEQRVRTAHGLRICSKDSVDASMRFFVGPLVAAPSSSWVSASERASCNNSDGTRTGAESAFYVRIGEQVFRGATSQHMRIVPDSV